MFPINKNSMIMSGETKTNTNFARAILGQTSANVPDNKDITQEFKCR